ncbi:MAG: hypothetical protein IT328_06050 [Caldilineaceae bacterium]|nr:hypothetical protein [Caldilineaceae bacterium]
MSATTARSIVTDVLGPNMTREIWTGNFDKALPISVQDFDISAVLPAVFYMFRFGHRRGKGRFVETFGEDAETKKERRNSTTIERVATRLSATEAFKGFQNETEQAILGDMLLSFSLENRKRALGRQEQIQRVAPSHYMASWIDLPDKVVDLRYVPETIVAMLADQKEQHVQLSREGDQTWFAVGQGFEDNVLLKAFHQGMVRDGLLGDRSADDFQEESEVGLDQLLMIRLAQQLGVAPDKLRGGEGERISNQRPIAERAARSFSEDIRRFVRVYAGVMPRHSFVELLESCMAVGLTTIVTSVIEILFDWANTGEILKTSEQQPAQFFVDCSNGVDRVLRGLAEQSMDDFMRRIEYFPVAMMALRLLDHLARYDIKLKKLEIQTRPYATEWLNLLGELLHERRREAMPILYNLEQKAAELAERLREDYLEEAVLLENDLAQPNPVWRLAEALTSLQGRKNAQAHVLKLIDSTLLITQPNGIATKRSVIRKDASGTGRRKREVRSLVLTDAALDYLVHLHVLRSGNKNGYHLLSFKEFIQILRERYGFCIDEAPEGMTISNEHLQQNRRVLERRLRDLGLLVGVNDAEAMKHLTPRFTQVEEADDELD